jgi:tetratricopeptide (TPR) repeat protein
MRPLGPLLLVTALFLSAQEPTTDQRILTLQKALAEQPRNGRAKMMLALACLQKVRETADYSYLDRAQSLIDQVISADTGNLEAVRLNNEIGLQKHEFHLVAESAADLTKLMPFDAGNWGNLGDALMELGEYQRAEQAYQRMASIRPNLESYNRAAYYKFVTGDSPGAIALMKSAIEAGSKVPENVAWCYAELGDMYFKTGDLPDARASYETALRLFPPLHRAHAGLGRLYAGEGNPRQAIASYQRARNAVPLVEYSAALEELYTSQGQKAEAQRQRALIDVVAKIAPTRGEKANRVLALIYIDEGRNPDAAISLAESELENRRDVYTDDALAWIYFQANRIEEASEHAKRALKFNTPEPVFYYHAGMIAAARGKNPEAIELLTHSLALNPKFDITKTKKARETLTALHP